MFIDKYNMRKITMFFLIYFYSNLNIAFSHINKFPESMEERREKKEGSILGNEAIEFKLGKSSSKEQDYINTTPGHSKSQLAVGAQNISAHNQKNIPNIRSQKNKLWANALQIVKNYPLLSSDYNGGVILTDWIANKSSPTKRYKLSIFIIEFNDQFKVDINIHQEEFIRGKWIIINNNEIQAFANQIRDAIIKEF